MSEDPKLFEAGDYNLFRYCHNDPIDFTDPMGLDAHALSGHVTPELLDYVTKGLGATEAYARVMGLVQNAMSSLGYGGISIGSGGYQLSKSLGTVSPVKTNVNLWADPKIHYEKTPTVTKRDGMFGPVQVPASTRPTVDPVTQSERQHDGTIDVYQRVEIDTRIGTSATPRQRELEMTNVRALVDWTRGRGASEVRNAVGRMQIGTSMEAERAVYNATVRSLRQFMGERALQVDSPLGEHAQ
jgi:hypothetical protein